MPLAIKILRPALPISSRAHQIDAILLNIVEHTTAKAAAIPFAHRKFRMMARGPLAVTERMRDLIKPWHAGYQQLFHRKFRTGMQIKPFLLVGMRAFQFGRKGLPDALRRPA